MRPFHASLTGLIAALLLPLAGTSETLRQVLQTSKIPAASFSSAELDTDVSGLEAHNDSYVYVAYLPIKDGTLTGYPHLVRLNRASGAVLRREPKADQKDDQIGSPESATFIDDFLVLSFNINPSAGSMIVVGKDFKPLPTFYGIGLDQIAPAQAVFVENTVHFAPAHPERLALADLRTGKNTELYPPEGDLLRAAFAHEHARHIPSQDTCAATNDPCQPELYDEDVTFLGADEQGSFAIAVQRDAAHAAAENETRESVASAAAVYLYAPAGSASGSKASGPAAPAPTRWLYCEQPLAADEAQALSGNRGQSWDAVKDRCIPTLPVVPDMSTADSNPTR